MMISSLYQKRKHKRCSLISREEKYKNYLQNKSFMYRVPVLIMVFTISSNEHTLKTVLNSKMASNTSITYMPKFQLSSTINTPHNMVSMVCLESCIITPPSMFTSPVLDDDTNKFDRYILNAGGVVVGDPQAYWITFN